MEPIIVVVRKGLGYANAHDENKKARAEASELIPYIGHRLKILIVAREVTREEENATITRWEAV